MNERQQHERMRAILRARIIFKHNGLPIDCLISNISPDGAKLALGKEVALPFEFGVHIPQKARTFRARLRWRSADNVGVEFLGDNVMARIRERIKLSLAAAFDEVRATECRQRE